MRSRRRPHLAALGAIPGALVALAAALSILACGQAAPAWNAAGSQASSAPAASSEASPAAPAAISPRDRSAGSDDGGLGAVPSGERDAVRSTLARIAAGGPFPRRRDGIVFANREGRLPPAPAGYYHEYTVETPGAADRGARRIVTGRGGEAFYSNDHYRSFLPLGPAVRGASR